MRLFHINIFDNGMVMHIIVCHIGFRYIGVIIFYVFVCLVFSMSLCASVYMCFVVTCWERADLLALVCGV